MKVFAGAVVFVFFIQSTVIGKRLKTRTIFRGSNGFLSDDPILEVEPLPPDVVVGDCNCVCCTPPPEPLTRPKCANDIVIAVDSSACFRDHHSRMMRFLKKLVRRIGRTNNIQYGGDETRLALMQFSSDIEFPLELSSFEDYTNPSTRKGVMDGLNRVLESLRFLGEGSFLNKALNATVEHIQAQPRPQYLLDAISPRNTRPIVIVITNGKSHPTVKMNDIEYSVADLQQAGVTVVPVSVTRECHGVQSDVWNEGLCPDTVVLNKLAKIGRPDSSTFMEMTSLETMADIINILECYTETDRRTGNYCNNCTCSCELPVGPRGPPGPKGPQGEFIEGPQGRKGGIGPKGSPGLDGPPGEKGDKGSFGDKGNDGPKGDKGIVGPKGGKGMIGPKGNIGGKGGFGEPGVPGLRGRKGDDGEKGMIGPKGGIGDKGEVGPKGRPGEKGNKGMIGPKGEKGIGKRGEPGGPGPRGPSGFLGPDGGKGPKGMTGPPGLCGKPGPAGKPGIEGIGGVNGVDGLPGPAGIQGPRGEPGADGDKGGRGDVGLPGNNGRRGLPGERGPSGPQGGRGVKGEKGEPSNEIGPQGLPGDRGTKGGRGRPGIDGLNGPEGQSGRQGPRGEQGPRGLPGEYNAEELRPIIVEIIRELLPGDCGE